MTHPVRAGHAAGCLRRSGVLLILLVSLSFCSFSILRADADALLAPAAVARVVSFAAEVEPLLAERCYSCHGPDRQRSGLRLDTVEAMIKGGDSGAAIVPGQSAESLLIQLVAGLEEDRVMPPKGDRLTDADIGLLRAWIDQGAGGETRIEADAVQTHWAFRPVVRPPVPVATKRGALNASSSPIDAFIASGLEAKGIELSPEADRTTIIRRLFAVMLGVPPTPEEVARFIDDPAPRAYERLVDRVLADSRYGERWARHWLDVVRFAESNGFETNRERVNAWRYRDYVIQAFNLDLPYDQFVREQLAGDALNAEVATGFLVGGPVDIVGSPDPVLTAQQRADELDDMVNTTGTAFLGLTVGCARCHAHKFDPIEHREYFALTAVFAGVRHGERALPMSVEDEARLVTIDRSRNELEGRLTPFLVPADAPIISAESPETVLRPAVNARENIEQFDSPVSARRLRFTILASSSGEPGLDELEVWSGERNVGLASSGAVPSASGTLPGYDIHQLEHLNDGQTGNRRSWISNEAGRGWVQLEWTEPVMIDRVVWSRDRENAFTDRVPVRYAIEVSSEPGRWRRVASSDDREPYAGPTQAPTGPAYRFDAFPSAEAERGRQWLAELEALTKEREQLMARRPMAYAGTFRQPGPVHRQHRGDPMQPREEVLPGSLAIFQPFALPTDAPELQRRLALADWVAHPDNPLTARVLVNRLWHYHFGVGLVDTPNDFGRNGSKPTHPELLDWLARELIERGWSIKAIQRVILLSATWRQSSAPRPAALEVDAASRLLWRFPPRRLEAEAIRDAILSVSGALDPIAGGPSFHLLEVDRENVYHYHPKETFGPSDFRRMVYAFKIRMEQDDIFGAFDCPDGSLVTPRRSSSTTPLQALNLYNSRFVLDQAERLARRLRADAGPDVDRQVQRA
jgi:mono/diheme cytochrome c family protein